MEYHCVFYTKMIYILLLPLSLLKGCANSISDRS